MTLTKEITLIFASIIAFCMIANRASSQQCACTLTEVANNTVSPCDLIIGSIDTVSSVDEFYTALVEANDNSGNRTILIADGDYAVASTDRFPYITGSNIVIRSLSGNRNAVTLRGTGMAPRSSTENGILIAGDNVTIADLTIREVGNHGIQISGHNLFVHNVRIEDCYEQLIKGSTSAISIDNATVQCSYMGYTAGIGPNWYIGGLDIHKGKDWIVRDNIFFDIASPSITVAEHAIHFWDGSENNAIERNHITNCDRGIGFGLGEGGPQNIGGIIRNNMIYNEGSHPYHDVGIGLESSPDTKVYNNTVHVQFQNAIEYRFESTAGVDITNNLTNRPIRSRNGGTGNLTTNVTEADDSWFESVYDGDLRVNATIAEVTDMGMTLTDVTEDIYQTGRPQNNLYDIGAFEKIQGTSSTEEVIKLLPGQSYNTYLIDGDYNQHSIEIWDMEGKLVKVENGTETVATIDLGNYPAGFYLIRFINKKNKTTSAQKIFVNQ